MNSFEFDYSDVRLTDLIDVPTLQKIQDAFANATGMAALTVDLEGSVTQLSNPTDFCMNFTRGSAVGAERCNQCDLKGGEEAGRTGRPAVYYCHGGLMDFAAPILLGNRQIGSMIGGQVLPEPPDEAKFRRIAHEIGVNEDDYIRALSKIKVMPKRTIEAGAQLLYIMANSLSQMGLQKFMTKAITQRLYLVSEEMSQKVEVALQDVVQISAQNTTLMKDFDKLMEATQQSTKQVEKTNQVIKYIGDVSVQTTLLGFNASVEASRAKEYGKGFGVIAQEIRRLADTSNVQSKKIEEVINDVKKTITGINGHIEKTYKSVKENTDTLEKMADVISGISESARMLEDLGRQLK